jgi:DNA-binding LacI/PurR family transcriptional regulator
VDNVTSAKQATEHLLDLGHSQVALILHASKSYNAASDRFAGYQQALADHGLEFQPHLVAQADFTPESGEEAMEQLLELPDRPGAVFATSDTVAIGAMRSIRRHGLSIPQDVAIVGFDDIPLAEYFDPPLTTIRLPAYELGQASAALLMAALANEGREPKRKLLQSKLIVRRSCGAHAYSRV